MSNLLTRVLSGAVLISLALGCLWLGGVVFTILVVVVGLGIVLEWTGLVTRLGWGVPGQMAGLLYVIPPIAGLTFMRGLDDGFELVLWTLAVVWATDIFAYFAGRSIGGARIAPKISPSKTWAGLIGGMIGAGITAMLLARYFEMTGPFIWLGAPLAVLAQVGDFFESWMKRKARVKDSGKIIPGHGGVMDRLDGLVPVASVVGALVWGGLM
jgi:phosphatidate cytidylyltransferase